MFGTIVGTLCLLGLVRMAVVGTHRSRRCAGDSGEWRRGSGQSRRRRSGNPGGFARAAGEVFKRKLDIDEDQEDLVDLAMKDARGTAKDLGQALHATRDDLAEAFRSHTVDDAGIAAVFASHDEEIARARREMISALKQIHAVLDPEQRERAADLLARGNGPRWV